MRFDEHFDVLMRKNIASDRDAEVCERKTQRASLEASVHRTRSKKIPILPSTLPATAPQCRGLGHPHRSPTATRRRSAVIGGSETRKFSAHVQCRYSTAQYYTDSCRHPQASRGTARNPSSSPPTSMLTTSFQPQTSFRRFLYLQGLHCIHCLLIPSFSTKRHQSRIHSSKCRILSSPLCSPRSSWPSSPMRHPSTTL